MGWSDTLRETHEDYAGVIAATHKLRLVVSARGASYGLQERAGGEWQRIASFPSGGTLLAHLEVVMRNVPRVFWQAVDGLPVDPRDCLSVPVEGSAQGVPDTGEVPCLRRRSRRAPMRGEGLPAARPVARPVKRRASPRRERPSLLREVVLNDGRLAWPVAAALGLSEVTFRARLRRGMTPDEATFAPLVRPGSGRMAAASVLGEA